MLKAGIVFLAVASLAAGSTILGVGSTEPAAAAPGDVCVPANLWFNTGGGSKVLYEYSPSGQLLYSVPLVATGSYGDIGFDSSGNLYGMQFTAVNPKLVKIDPANGTIISGVTVTGIVAGVAYNALSALPNGDFLLGSDYLATIYEVNPATGVATVYDTYPTIGAGIFTSAGDFLGLPGDDILAIANKGAETELFRIHPDLTMTEVGTVPAAYGAAESGNAVYLAGANGDIYSFDSIPTAASTALLTPDTTVPTGLGFYGASSVQDAGGAACGAPPTLTSGAPANGGVGVTYLQTVSASGAPTIVFNTTAGVLPTGLTGDPNTGVISGVPTTVGSYTYTVTAYNDFGTTSATYTTTISNQPPSMSAAASARGRVGSAYSQAPGASGTPPFSFSLTSGRLPAGLTLDPSTGVISGVPLTAGTFRYTLTISSAFGSSSQANTITISDILAATGVDAGGPLAIGAALLLFGSALLGWSRQRKRKTTTPS